MKLFKGCEIYAPEHLGKKDILVAGEKIILIGDDLEMPDSMGTEVVDVPGLIAVPGLIDSHVHIAGAGGEGGPASRTPEMQLSQMLEAGITTVVGCLGTDGMTRNIESVLMKAKALKQEGVSAYLYTGAYQVPTPTILGDVGRDIALIEEVIGTGEIALSDHRSSSPTVTELIRLASHSRVGGMLGGKAGIVNIHMGDAENPFQPLYDVVSMSELSLKQFLPTHCNRNKHIFEEAKVYGKESYVDITTSGYKFFPDEEVKPSVAVAALLKAGVPPGHISMSSDGCGSLPMFDSSGKLLRLESGSLISMLEELRDCVLQEGVPLDKALAVVTSNVAGILGLKMKGRLEKGRDADILFLNREFEIVHMSASGEIMVRNGDIIRKGTYEGS